MTERKAAPGTTPFYKGVGGYDTMVKVRGRWYWVGNTSGANTAFHAYVIQQGARLTRVGTPAPLRRAWKEHGATWATVINNFSQWTTEVGL